MTLTLLLSGVMFPISVIADLVSPDSVNFCHFVNLRHLV
jgi:hypothetical protein